jgi:hypothetical protein
VSLSALLRFSRSPFTSVASQLPRLPGAGLLARGCVGTVRVRQRPTGHAAPSLASSFA